MKHFLNKASHGKSMTDKVFKAAIAAKKDTLEYGPSVVNATLGTLYDEKGNLVAFDSVWEPYNAIDQVQKAKYASSIQGNPSFQQAVKDWLFGTIKPQVMCDVIATPGGAGAVSSTLKNTLNTNESVLKPEIGWGPYNTMAQEHGIETINYNLFIDDHFDTRDIIKKATAIMKNQGKVVVIINDPCHNPTGYTLTEDEWDIILENLSSLSKEGPVVLIHDIAYIDFNTLGHAWKHHFKKYTKLPASMMVVIAFSISKTLTAYGARAGAQVVLCNDKKERQIFVDASIYSARSIWSTVNNSAMVLFSTITQDIDKRNTFEFEKQRYIDLLKERATIFTNEADIEGLEYYPYKEGFFVTLKVEDENEADIMYEQLVKNHIHGVLVAKGIRIAICSVSKAQLKGLAAKITQAFTNK